MVDALRDEEAEEESRSDQGQEPESAGPGYVAALANVLTHLASLSGRPNRVTRFHAVRAPQLSIHDYLVRIATYFQCSHECFVLGLVYIDRIVKLHPEFTISNLNIHRLFVTSVMLAAKFFDDVYYSNSYYAKVGGVKTQELNALEALFLRLIEWRLHVLPQEYEQYRHHVLTAVRGGDARLNCLRDEDPSLTEAIAAVKQALQKNSMESEWTSGLAADLKAPSQAEVVNRILIDHGWIGTQFNGPPDRNSLLTQLEAAQTKVQQPQVLLAGRS